MNLVECKRKRIVKEVARDDALIEALKKKSRQKEAASEKLGPAFVDDQVSLLYDALRVILEGLASAKGLKIYNHECYAAFLKEVIKAPLLGDEFDACRRIRNALNYYGKELVPDEAAVVLQRMRRLLRELRRI